MNPLRTLVFTLLLVILASHSWTADRQVINPKDFRPHGRPYSPAIRAGNTLYISGQGSQNSEGKLSESFEERARQCLLNVRAILQGGGMDFANLVSVHVYLTDLGTLELVNRIYWQMMGDNPPARTVLGVAALPGGNTIEITAIAVADARAKRAIWPRGWTRSAQADPPAIQAGELLYLSGVGARSANQSLPYSEQVKAALDNAGTVLAAAGMSHKNLLWVNPYLDDVKQYGAMNKVYETYFEFGNTPGRGTIHVNALPRGEHIVLSGIAGEDLSKRRAIKPRNMPPSSTASPGVLYGDTLYLSAKSGFIPGQGIVTKDFELQLRQTMRNLLDGLEEADMNFTNAVSAVVYLKDMKDYDAMNQLYRTFFKTDFPSRTTIQQNQDRETQTEEQISIIAVRGEKP
ncbi:MAG TPA: RidA family protein [Terriglobia bacterium]|nr:RidA family protein [Terriglobia bacterium]